MPPELSRSRWIHALPWVVGLITVGPFVAALLVVCGMLVRDTLASAEPLPWVADPEAAAHASAVVASFSVGFILFMFSVTLPTTLWLLSLARECAERTSTGASRLPLGLAAVLGGAVGV